MTQTKVDSDWRRQIAAVATAGDMLAKELRQLQLLWNDRGSPAEDACPSLWQMFGGGTDSFAGDGSPIRSPGAWELAVAEWRRRGWLPPEDAAA